jgi:hypothetical protein
MSHTPAMKANNGKVDPIVRSDNGGVRFCAKTETPYCNAGSAHQTLFDKFSSFFHGFFLFKLTMNRFKNIKPHTKVLFTNAPNAA